MIVEEIRIRGATIRVHDRQLCKPYKRRDPKQYRRMQSDYQRSINTKRENRVSGRKEGQAWKR